MGFSPPRVEFFLCIFGGGGGGGLSSLLMFTALARKRTLNLKQTTINLVVVRKGCCVAT